MSSAVPLASAAAVDLALGATVAANDDDNADGAVFPPSSTENEGAYVDASVRRRLTAGWRQGLGGSAPWGVRMCFSVLKLCTGLYTV